MYRTFRAVSEATRVEEEPVEEPTAAEAEDRGMVDRVIGALSTGEVTDDDVRASLDPAEDPDEV